MFSGCNSTPEKINISYQDDYKKIHSLYGIAPSDTLEAMLHAYLKEFPEAVHAKLFLARVHYDEGRLESALKIYNQLLAEDSTELTAAIGAGIVLHALGNYAEAEKLLAIGARADKTGEGRLFMMLNALDVNDTSNASLLMQKLMAKSSSKKIAAGIAAAAYKMNQPELVRQMVDTLRSKGISDSTCLKVSNGAMNIHEFAQKHHL